MVLLNFSHISIILLNSPLLVVVAFYHRRERTAALNLSSEVEADFLADIEEQLTSPSSFYTGTGGKPPLSFTAVNDTKSHKKRYGMFMH